MGNQRNRSQRDTSNRAADGDANARKERFARISKATSQIVRDAAVLLDEEVAAGIVAARKMQQTFHKERRIDPDAFTDALQRFQNDGHHVVNLLNEQVSQIRSEENTELIGRLVNNSHDLLDLAVGMINIGVEITNQLIQTDVSKTGTRGQTAEGATPKSGEQKKSRQPTSSRS